MDISIVGAGRAGTAVAVLWQRAGHRIVAVSGGAATAERATRHLPGVPVLGAPDAARAAELVVIGVPDDLIAATKEKKIAGALLDVFRQEPLPSDHPFWMAEGIIVLPHIGGPHPERDRFVARLFVDNLGRFLDGATVADLPRPVEIVPTDGRSLVAAIRP